jgi:ABC-2 type transport system permease protein
MITFRDFTREARFIASNRTTRLTWLALAFICSLALILGHLEIQRQLETIERTRSQDQVELVQALASAPDYGGAAYAAFSLTWNSPADAAFLAIGQRDLAPWMLRIRALALEGQIHEADNFNPELSLAGRFDYAFVIAFILPLFVIVLLYDVYSAERDAGRVAMLTATAASPVKVWAMRITTLTLGMAMACMLPLWLLGAWFGASAASLVAATASVLLSLFIWTLIAAAVAFGAWSAAVSAAILTGCWLMLALLIPLSGKLLIDRAVPGVDGAQISMVQRETVNGAWDLPKSATMDRFYASHPQWADSEPVTAPFHWKWYYAFQQVGDETAAPLSTEYRAAVQARDQLSGYVAWLSPPVATMRLMQKIAKTDVQSALRYELEIRHHHARIRHFFYPLLFEEPPFSHENLSEFPRFTE